MLYITYERSKKMKTYMLLLLVSIVVCFLTGCFDPGSTADENKMGARFFTGMTPDPKDPDGGYTGVIDLWLAETFGPDSGWHKSWVRALGSPEEKEMLQLREEFKIAQFKQKHGILSDSDQAVLSKRF